MSSRLRSLRCLLLAVLVTGGMGVGSARAQVPVSASLQEPAFERAQLRLRLGAALRRGGQQDAGPGLSYAGHTLNDVALEASGVGPGFARGALAARGGLRLSLQREAFSLREAGASFGATRLLRASLGPALHLGTGGVRAELGAGYELAQLPLFGDSRAPQLARATRHAALLGARLLLPLPLGLGVELRGALPVTLATREATGAAASASGLSAGAALHVPFAQRGRWAGTLVLDAQHVRDRVEAAGARSQQRLNRLGLALQVGLQERPPSRMGALRVQVRDGRTGTPLRYVPVLLRSGGREQGLRTSDGAGELLAQGLAPGEHSARVELPGYLPAEARVHVVAGALARLELRAQPEPFSPPPTGTLRVRVVDATNRAPLAGALVELGGEALETDGDGEVRVPSLEPGPLAVRVAHAQYQPGEEAVLVVAGSETQLPVGLTPLRARAPALLLGQVRSASLGRPVRATLEIPDVGLRTVTNEGGAFAVRVPAGTYRVIISAGEHLTQTKRLTVREGEQAIFNVDLFPSRR